MTLYQSHWSILFTTRKYAEVFFPVYISRMNGYCVCSTYSSTSFIYYLFIPNIQNIHSPLQILSIFPADKTSQEFDAICFSDNITKIPKIVYFLEACSRQRNR